MLDALDSSQQFRRHRHDVMNALQLVKAYVQLGKSEAAVQAVDDVAEWLHSLSAVQTAQDDGQLLWTAATCPRLRLSGLEAVNGLPMDVETELCSCLQLIDDFAAEVGLKKLRVSLFSEPETNTHPVGVRFELPEEFRLSWQTIHSAKEWCYLQVDTADGLMSR
jgi:hypothetical protein